mmetsp:Transcript_94978/g.174053  ORF Transcript_94978/g.174053 Transcript_94978/m.174053 type:complete len:81 (-) Transcript_94978:1717-1959(-)
MEAVGEAGKTRATPSAERHTCQTDASQASITSVELKWDMFLLVARPLKSLTLIAVRRAETIPDASSGCAKVVKAALSNVG